VLLGDAAGYVHPIIGEGMASALRSANPLATVSKLGGVQKYEGLWWEEFDNGLLAASMAAAVLVALTLFIGVPHTQGRLRELETSPPSTEVRDRW
jgi:flavin-dependent dehydrogenase